MNKVFVDKTTNVVSQIINIDKDPRWSEDWFSWCYVVDDPDNKINSYGYTYNLETKKFEEIKGYKEPEVIIEEKQEVQDIQDLKKELEMTQRALNEIIMSHASERRQ